MKAFTPYRGQVVPVLLVLSLFAAGFLLREPETDQDFLYDPADIEVAAERIEGSASSYDAGIAVLQGSVFMAWLEFNPGEGDHLFFGRLDGAELDASVRVSQKPKQRARPALTVSGQSVWLSWEEGDADEWSVLARRRRPDGRFGEAIRISTGRGQAIGHRTAPAGNGGVRAVWQEAVDGQFEIFSRQIGSDGSPGAAERLSENERGDWHPVVAALPDGGWVVAWDQYDGVSYNVVARRLTARGWSKTSGIATGSAFEGRPDLATDRAGRVWIAWEEGAEDWGKPFRGKEKVWDNITDAYGPLHRFRQLRVGLLDEANRIRLLETPLPMPSRQLAATRSNRREGVSMLGSFYERARLVRASDGPPWLIYRHFYQPQIGLTEPVQHHVEAGWKLYARRPNGKGWSKLVVFDLPQRDGLQRLTAAEHAGDLRMVWTTGRTDRRVGTLEPGLAVAGVAAIPADATPSLRQPVELSTPAVTPSAVPLADAEVGGKTWDVYFGDLHRHTDLSLCFPFFDGSLDDAYRYGMDGAGLDFLAVTDHSRDIARGDPLSQLWWRSTKEAARHNLRTRFRTYFAFERSNRHTDHNVISLRSDMLRRHTPPLPEFWAELDDDTITLPHATGSIPGPALTGAIWDYQDDKRRPLIEIYQGFRDKSIAGEAEVGLAKGFHLGFVASSDHMSSSAGYAAVWSAEDDREAIFRAMQARRTYGATDRIRLVFRSGPHWMGERIAASGLVTFQLEVDGTAPIERVQLVRDGIVIQSEAVAANTLSLQRELRASLSQLPESRYYVYIRQADGNQAWSSPIWVRKSDK